MSGLQLEHYDRIGAMAGRTRAFAVTSTPARVDLAADAYLGTHVAGGRKLTLYADGNDIYYFFASGTTETIDDTAVGDTTPMRQCDCIPKGTAIEIRPPRNRGTFCGNLYYKCASGSAATLRISVLSPGEDKYLQR